MIITKLEGHMRGENHEETKPKMFTSMQKKNLNIND
jgi:hypothetical protein